ncbi:MAG: DUF2953 domain-containing protein [Euryarchaeota archaeon]|nr:DUF2953 domain-containing protein [Euryarchaeota archaeon]
MGDILHPSLLIFLLLAISTLALALMLLLWIPFVFRFELKRDPNSDPVQRIKVRWLFLSRVIDGFAATGQEDRREEKEDAKVDVGRIFELFRTLHSPVIALARRVVQRIDFRELSCRATFGLDDPADTGMLSGFLYAALIPLTRYPAISIQLHPVFHESTFAYRVRGSLGVTVGRMVIPAIRFLCNRAVRRVIVGRVRSSLSSSGGVPGRVMRKRLPGGC